MDNKVCRAPGEGGSRKNALEFSQFFCTLLAGYAIRLRLQNLSLSLKRTVEDRLITYRPFPEASALSGFLEENGWTENGPT